MPFRRAGLFNATYDLYQPQMLVTITYMVTMFQLVQYKSLHCGAAHSIDHADWRLVYPTVNTIICYSIKELNTGRL